MSLPCSDNPERRLTLKRDASALRLEQKYHMQDDGWSVSSVAQLSSRISVELSLISNPSNTPFQNDFQDHAGYTPEKSCLASNGRSQEHKVR